MISDLGKCPNQKKKQFFDKVLYNDCSKFVFGAIRPKTWCSKNGFPIVFSKKVIWVGTGTVFFVLF